MYLDPGFGGMLVQVIIAIVAVAGGVLFSFRKKIKGLFSKSKEDTSAVNTANMQDTTDDAIDMIDEDKK